jgi:hypothetical protein
MYNVQAHQYVYCVRVHMYVGAWLLNSYMYSRLTMVALSCLLCLSTNVVLKLVL